MYKITHYLIAIPIPDFLTPFEKKHLDIITPGLTG